MCEAAYVTAEKGYVKVFVKRPDCIETARSTFTWKGSGGQMPVLVVRWKEGDLDLSEYTDRNGRIDWTMCKVKI